MIRETRQVNAAHTDLRGIYTVIGIPELTATAEAASDHGLMAIEQVAPEETYRWDDYFHLDADQASAATMQAIAASQQSKDKRFPPLSLIRLRDAIVTGNGTVLTRGGGLLRESAFEWFNFGAAPPNFTALPDARFYHAPQTGRDIHGCHFLLKQIPNPVNFGHWLVEGLATAALFHERIMAEGCGLIIPMSRDLRMTEIMLASLLSVFPRHASTAVLERDVGDAWRVDELEFVTSLHVPPAKSRLGLAALRKALLPPVDLSSGGKRRLYVSRANASTRRLLNEFALIDVLRTFDFAAIAPESLPFSEQVRAFAEADLVVGPKGANLANIIFMRPGSHVVALAADDFPDTFFRDIVAGSGVHYSEIYGSTRDDVGHDPGFRDFGIDVERVRRLVQSLI
jgi:hypothetical protein